jgi:putative transposase
VVGHRLTKVLIEGFGWVYWVVVLDWVQQEGGRSLCRPAGPRLALAGRFEPRREPAVPGRNRGPGVNLMADNGCQPTSLAFLRACTAMDIRQAFTSYSDPKGNADTERFLRTLKEELVWLREWTSPAAFFEALDRWLADYNITYLHSAVGYRAPNAFEAEHLSRATPPNRRLLYGEQYMDPVFGTEGLNGARAAPS